MPARDGVPWLVDEYVIVGDLWLRRGRAVGTSDAEVKQIAADIGRSPAAVSRRVGNFAGTDNPGTGLKAILGEPLAVWQRLREDRAQLAEAVADARSRLALLTASHDELVADRPSARVVAPERPSIEPVQVMTDEQLRMATQTEAVLRENFRAWRDPRGTRLKGVEIAVGETRLRADLFDPYVSLLIEVKAQPGSTAECRVLIVS